MKFHMLGLSHLPLSKTFSSCAFSQKNLKLSKMLCSLGHEVYYYGARSTDKSFNIEEYVNSDKFHFIETHTVEDIARSFGEGDNRFEIGYNWKEVDYKHDLSKQLNERSEVTKKFYENSIKKINEIKKNDDFLLCTQGSYHKPIADAVNLFLTCESGIGYRGSIKSWYRAFESAYIQNFTYGSENPFKSINGNFYDRVIPNYFDPDDIEFSDKKEDYYLFCARLIKRKGILEAYLTTKAIGAKLIIAGQGGRILPNGHLTSYHGNEFDIAPDCNWEYIGLVSIEERKKLMANAKGFFSPSEYIECFGGSHVEALLSGTPVLTTNFGVYGTNDTFIDGLDGFQCNTIDDFAWGALQCEKLNSTEIRKRSEKFLMDNVKWEYQRWFDDLYQVYLSTTDKNIKAFHNVRTSVPEWRKKLYPELTKGEII